jgi:hypothetical protein
VGHSYRTPHGRQRYGGAKHQELHAALVAFIWRRINQAASWRAHFLAVSALRPVR